MQLTNISLYTKPVVALKLPYCNIVFFIQHARWFYIVAQVTMHCVATCFILVMSSSITLYSASCVMHFPPWCTMWKSPIDTHTLDLICFALAFLLTGQGTLESLQTHLMSTISKKKSSFSLTCAYLVPRICIVSTYMYYICLCGCTKMQTPHDATCTVMYILLQYMYKVQIINRIYTIPLLPV